MQGSDAVEITEGSENKFLIVLHAARIDLQLIVIVSRCVETFHNLVYLKEEAAERLKPLEDACNEARFEAAAAASLHEFTKDVYDIWQNSGVFARRRALKEIRERAGFRLESHRAGNYVAKTFDLQNTATARIAEAQQAMHKANLAYKIKSEIYGLIADTFSA